MVAHSNVSGHQFKGVLEGLHGQLNVGSPEGGGFSRHMVTGETPSEGYMVSLPGSEKHIEPASAARPHHLANYVRTNREALSQPENSFGGWNPGTHVDLDTSRNIKPDPGIAAEHGHGVARVDALEKTLSVGIAHRQKAVYDVKNDRAIRVR